MAWPPPQPKADEGKDKAAGSKTTKPSITVATTGTPNAPPPQREAKQASAIFCKQLIGRNEVCSQVRKPHKVGQQGERSVVRLQKPTDNRGSKQKDSTPAAAEKSEPRSENLPMRL